jgi:hypothetical protein
LGETVAKLDPEKLSVVKLLTAGRKPGDVILNLEFDPYVCSFRHVSTHLLLRQVTEADVRQALVEGRAYVAFDWIADPTGFVFRADHHSDTWPIGSDVPFAAGLELKAEAPLEGRFKLFRNGKLIAEQNGPALSYSVDKPGVYRVEVWLNVAGEHRPWILTNPIYVRATE